MPYIGNISTTNFSSITKDTFSGNGSATAFTLSKTATTNGVAVYVENVRQIPTTAYSVSGTTLTFTGTPPSGTNNIYVMHHNTPVSTATHPSTQALEATSGTFSGDVSLPDNVKVKLGTGDDGEIFFEGTSTVIKHGADSGQLRLETRRFDVKNTANDAHLIKAIAGNSVSLYQNGIEKLKTQSTGVKITGNVIIDTSGNGIDFSAQTTASSASASATGELFDRYEEGIFTHSGNANMTINSVSARGFYQIVGNRCFVNGFVRFTHSSTNNVFLYLPVASKGDITSPANGENESATACWFPSVNTSGGLGGVVIAYVASGGGAIFFYNTGTASGLINNNNLDSTAEVYYNLNYVIA